MNQKIFMERKEFAARRTKLMQRSILDLIEMLTSKDLQTRFLAEMCLRNRTSV